MVIIHKEFRLRLETYTDSHVVVSSDKRSTLLALFEDCPPPRRGKKQTQGIPWKWEINVSRGRSAAVIGGLAMNIDEKLKKNARRRKNETSG